MKAPAWRPTGRAPAATPAAVLPATWRTVVRVMTSTPAKPMARKAMVAPMELSAALTGAPMAPPRYPAESAMASAPWSNRGASRMTYSRPSPAMAMRMPPKTLRAKGCSAASGSRSTRVGSSGSASFGAGAPRMRSAPTTTSRIGTMTRAAPTMNPTRSAVPRPTGPPAPAYTPMPATTPRTMHTMPAKSAPWPRLAWASESSIRTVSGGGGGGAALRERDEALVFLAGGRFEEVRGAGFFLAPDRFGVPRVAVTVGPTVPVPPDRTGEGWAPQQAPPHPRPQVRTRFGGPSW